jgi:predicted DNA binding CopG/RHH family protein
MIDVIVLSARDRSKKEHRFMSKLIPKFKNEDEEREFWSKHDSSKYLNWKNAERVLFPNLKPSTRSISLRLPEWLLDAVRQMANERNVSYQSLIKIFLQERIERDLKSRQLSSRG